MVELRFDGPDEPGRERVSQSIFIAAGDWMALADAQGGPLERSAWRSALLAAEEDLRQGAPSRAPAERLLRRWLKPHSAGGRSRQALIHAAERLGRSLSEALGARLVFEDSWALRRAEPERMWSGMRARIPEGLDPAASFAAIEEFFQRQTRGLCVSQRYPCAISAPEPPSPSAMRQLRESAALESCLQKSERDPAPRPGPRL